MDTKRRKDKAAPGKVRKIILIILLVLAILAVVVMILQGRVKTKFASSKSDDVITGQVTRGDISSSVSGSGILNDDDVKEITFPKSMVLDKIHVRRGDVVEEGQLLASVELNTVLTAMNELNDSITSLDKEIASASGEKVNSAISSTVKGRVKQIFAQKGDSVLAVMGEKGALCVLSMDGKLLFDFEAEGLTAGDSVSVETGGKTFKGSVENVLDGVVTVSVTDNGPLVGAEAAAFAEDGTVLGSGELTISSPLRVIGYAGTISAVYTAENRDVYVGSALFALTDTAYTANYETLLSQRQDKEEEMQELIAIYRSGGLYADFSGTVKSIDAVEGEPEANSDGSLPQQSFSISPDATMTLSLNVDESEILSVEIGQAAVVTVDSIGDESFAGKVRSIDRVGTSANGVTIYTADIEIDKQDGMLAGMSASATITIDGVQDVLLIPVDALQKTRTGYFVYTTKDEDGNMGGMKEVTAGISNSNYVEITSGLTEGEIIYYKEKQQDFFSMFMRGGYGSYGGSGARPSGGYGSYGGSGARPSGGYGGSGARPSGGSRG